MCSKTSTAVLPSYGGIFDFANKEARLAEVVKLTEDPAVWADAKQAQELGRERKSLEGIIATMRDFDERLKDSRELFALAREESDDSTLEAVEADVGVLEKIVADMEFRRMFANPMDPNNAFVDIQSGAGERKHRIDGDAPAHVLALLRTQRFKTEISSNPKAKWPA
jgi:peptide chain release factor 2